jgi:multiple sugar transport system permease protein
MASAVGAAPARFARGGGVGGVGRWERSAGRRVLLPLAGFALALTLISPYLVMFFTALKPAAELRATPARLTPQHWRFGNFGDVFGDPNFQGWLKVSLIVALASTGVVLVAAVPAAYFTARNRFRGRTAFLVLVLVTQMFSPTALVVGLYREFFDANLINTYAALILTNAAFNLAFAIWILNGFFSSIPREIEEAAMLDGCGRVRTLLRVMFPLAAPGVVTAVIFTFIAAWNEYVVALTLMTEDAKKPLTVGINSYVTAYEQHWDQLFAASIVAIVPVVVLFAVIERYLVGGLTAGSVK